MIKNGKYFVSPPKDDSDIKELFQRLAAEGAGSPVDEGGFAKSPWTPELLADAISELDANTSGIELRTVQRWFQDNDTGIGPENLRWLARIFGCEDPVATSEWQAALSAAQSRLNAKRRQARVQAEISDREAAAELERVREANKPRRGSGLARQAEALFSSRSPLDLPVLVFAGAVTLGFLAYIMGVHSVTYSPVEGLTKQVGFLWSPSWTIEGLVLLPLFLIVVTGLRTYWTDQRPKIVNLNGVEMRGDEEWARKVESYSIAYWVIFLACLLIICILQWTTTYLSAFMNGAAKSAMIDWMIITVVRPDVLSIKEAFTLSILAFLYSGMIYWFYFVGLLLLYTIAEDFHDKYNAPEKQLSEAHRDKTLEIGTRMMQAIFRCTVFGILIAMCIKLNTAYLLSDGADIVSWLINDALSAFGIRDIDAGWLDASALPYFTSVLLVMLTCFVFFASFAQIYWVLNQLPASDVTKASWHTSWYKMISVVLLTVVSFLLIGQFQGFSILLVGSVVVATYSLLRSK